jgi:hypothetical protein
LEEYANAGGYNYARAWVMAEAEWDGEQHLVMVHYFAVDEDQNGRTYAPNDDGDYCDWHWPYPDSVFFGGAQLSVREWSPSARQANLFLQGQPVKVDIDWQAMFVQGVWRTPMPLDRPVAIWNVLWANELVGLNRIHTSVWDMRQHGFAGDRRKSPPKPDLVSATAWENSETPAVRRLLLQKGVSSGSLVQD